MVNMEVWIPPQLDTMPLLNSHEVKECGSIAPPGHFGWFVPIALSRRSDSWIIFTELEKASRFEMDESTLENIRNFTIDPKNRTYYCQESYCQRGMYIPEWCQGKPCALLLTSYINATSFVKDHIDQMKLYVKVIWFGSNLKHVIKLAEELLFDRNSSTSTDRYYTRSLLFKRYNRCFGFNFFFYGFTTWIFTLSKNSFKKRFFSSPSRGKPFKHFCPLITSLITFNYISEKFALN